MSGRFCCHGIGFWHDGQNDRRGWLTDKSRGSRQIQTFKNEPATARRTKERQATTEQGKTVPEVSCAFGETDKPEVKSQIEDYVSEDEKERVKNGDEEKEKRREEKKEEKEREEEGGEGQA